MLVCTCHKLKILVEREIEGPIYSPCCLPIGPKWRSFLNGSVYSGSRSTNKPTRGRWTTGLTLISTNPPLTVLIGTNWSVGNYSWTPLDPLPRAVGNVLPMTIHFYMGLHSGSLGSDKIIRVFTVALWAQIRLYGSSQWLSGLIYDYMGLHSGSLGSYKIIWVFTVALWAQIRLYGFSQWPSGLRYTVNIGDNNSTTNLCKCDVP